MKMKKIGNERGFTLTEMLATLIILGFVTLCVASGVATAVRCYQDLMFESESRLFISSLNESLEDILRYAKVLDEGTGKRENPDEDGYKKVATISFYKEKYSKNNKQLSTYVLIPGEFSVENRTGRLKLNDSVVGGAGIYSQSLYIENFELRFHESRRIFKFSYTVRDGRNHSTESDWVYVNSWM